VSSEPEVLTVKEAAALLRVCEETVRRKAFLGELPGRKVGDWRFSRRKLLEMLESEMPRDAPVVVVGKRRP
jgi:excisionase family DNA binding protein